MLPLVISVWSVMVAVQQAIEVVQINALSLYETHRKNAEQSVSNSIYLCFRVEGLSGAIGTAS